MKNTSSRALRCKSRGFDHVWISLIITAAAALARLVFARAFVGVASTTLAHVSVAASPRARVYNLTTTAAVPPPFPRAPWRPLRRGSFALLSFKRKKERKKNTESYAADGYLPCEYILYCNTHSRVYYYYNIRKSARWFNYWSPPRGAPYHRRPVDDAGEARICSEGCG